MKTTTAPVWAEGTGRDEGRKDQGLPDQNRENMRRWVWRRVGGRQGSTRTRWTGGSPEASSFQVAHSSVEP